MWNNVEAAPEDAILGLTEAFKKDPRDFKVNLGVGVYKDAAGNTPILPSVRTAEKKIFETEVTKNYLPIAGDAAYGVVVQKLIFGNLCDRSATVHTPGGTGALRLGAELIARFNGNTIWVSNPTWANHHNIFKAAGLTVNEYPYYNPQTKDLDADAFFAALEKIPAGHAVLLHACCHNPSGVDLTNEQWERTAAIAKKNGWFPLVDFAYQGFGSGLAADRAGIEILRAAGVEFLIASSFSKNFGLYRDRTGALTAVAANAGAAETAMSHMKAQARVLYSNPPAHGGMIVTTIMNNPELEKIWHAELDDMCSRIAKARTALADGLAARDVKMDCSFMTRQKGMFSFSGLNKTQVEFLRKEKAVYIVGSGRISVAGITPSNLETVCDAIAEAFTI